MAGALPLQVAGGRAAVGGGALDNRWEDRIESRNAEENEWSFDPSTQSPLPFDTTAAPPAEASAPAASRCESCGAPANAPGLCGACERAFHTVLESPVDTQPADSDDHAAQLDALFRALDSAPPAAPTAPAIAPVDVPAVAAFDAAPAADPYAASEFVFASAPAPAPYAASEPRSPAASTFFMPPFAAPAGAGDHTSHTPAPEPARVPFANITAAAEPRPLLFASPLSGAPETNAAGESEAPSEYRSVLLPAEPAEAPPVNAASPAPATDVDFSTVMMPRLSTAQLEAAQSPLAVAAEVSPVSYEPVIAHVIDPVVAHVSEPVVEQAVAPVAEPPAVEAIEPAVAVATPPIRLKLRDDPPPPVAPVIPVIEEHVVDEAPAAASPSPVAAAEAAQPAVESKSAPAPAQSQKPAAAAKAPAAQSSPAKSRSALRGLATAAAVLLIVGAIGVPLGRLWLGRGQQIVPVAATAPRPAPVQTATPKQQPAAPQAVPAAATAVTTAAVAPAPAAAAPVKPVPPAATRKPPTRAAAKPAAVEPQVPQIAAVAPTFVGEAPPAAALPAPEPIAPAPVAPAAPESPIGPFYETRSVDQAPQVTNRVEPRLPASLHGQPVKEIVIVRVLVSQTGKAALTSVLRRSKAGLELDNAVLAAVRQWSFTPAMKKGEAVSCFLHVGVAVGE